jgi:hypothetical protein
VSDNEDDDDNEDGDDTEDGDEQLLIENAVKKVTSGLLVHIRKDVASKKKPATLARGTGLGVSLTRS